MRFQNLMALTVLLAGFVAVVSLTGCKGKAESAKDAVLEVINTEDEKPLDPGVKKVIDDEFSGIEMEVSATDSRVSGAEGYSGPSLDKGVYLLNPVFKTRTDDGSITELSGAGALVDPERKCVVFDQGATVTGPRKNVLICDRLVWYYTKETIETDGGFTLTNGRGTVSGATYRSDVSFRTVSVE